MKRKQVILTLPKSTNVDDISRCVNELEKMDVQADFQKDGNNNYNLSLDMAEETTEQSIAEIAFFIGRMTAPTYVSGVPIS